MRGVGGVNVELSTGVGGVNVAKHNWIGVEGFRTRHYIYKMHGYRLLLRKTHYRLAKTLPSHSRDKVMLARPCHCTKLPYLGGCVHMQYFRIQRQYYKRLPQVVIDSRPQLGQLATFDPQDRNTAHKITLSNLSTTQVCEAQL